MIDARELRLNNSVLSKLHNGLITEIRDLGPAYLRLWANPLTTYKYEDIDPIPLTPEILKKAGFINIPVADDVSYQQLSHDFIDIYTGDKNGICEVVFAIEDHEIRRVRYVHDLQNVFFALTNQEIKI